MFFTGWPTIVALIYSLFVRAFRVDFLEFFYVVFFSLQLYVQKTHQLLHSLLILVFSCLSFYLSLTFLLYIYIFFSLFFTFPLFSYLFLSFPFFSYFFFFFYLPLVCQEKKSLVALSGVDFAFFDPLGYGRCELKSGRCKGLLTHDSPFFPKHGGEGWIITGEGVAADTCVVSYEKVSYVGVCECTFI